MALASPGDAETLLGRELTAEEASRLPVLLDAAQAELELLSGALAETEHTVALRASSIDGGWRLPAVAVQELVSVTVGGSLYDASAYTLDGDRLAWNTHRVPMSAVVVFRSGYTPETAPLLLRLLIAEVATRALLRPAIAAEDRVRQETLGGASFTYDTAAATGLVVTSEQADRLRRILGFAPGPTSLEVLPG